MATRKPRRGTERPDDDLLTVSDMCAALGGVAADVLPMAGTRDRSAMPENSERRAAGLAK